MPRVNKGNNNLIYIMALGYKQKQIQYQPNHTHISGSFFSYDNTVTLNPQTAPLQFQSGVAQYAHRTEEYKAAGKFNARKLDESQSDEISLMGSLGEVAVALKLGIPFIVEQKPGEPDFAWNNCKIDVKTSERENLLISKRHLHDDWFYFAVQKQGDNFSLLGWTTAAKVKENADKYYYNGNSRGPAYIVPNSDLTPFKNLIGELL